MIAADVGTGKRINSLVSRMGGALPFRFKFEFARKPLFGREAEFARIRQTFKSFIPPIAVGEHLGTGGFADVFLARSYYDGVVDFAIKILRSDLLAPRKGFGVSAEQDQMRIRDIKKRFTNESFIQFHLSQSIREDLSRSIVRVFDHGEFDDRNGYRFILMEQMGHTMRQFIDEVFHSSYSRSLLTYKIDLMITIATIIANVHKEGIFHRDIKPENILFVRLRDNMPSVKFAGSEKNWPAIPEVKLGDFGTVRWVRSYSDHYDATIIGTHYYMSPEQILEPRHLDARTDIYSFGVACYELLFGVHPIDVREGTKHILLKIAHAKPVRRSVPPGCENLGDILFKCLEKVDLRYQSMSEVLRDLLAFREKWRSVK